MNKKSYSKGDVFKIIKTGEIMGFVETLGEYNCWLSNGTNCDVFMYSDIRYLGIDANIKTTQTASNHNQYYVVSSESSNFKENEKYELKNIDFNDVRQSFSMGNKRGGTMWVKLISDKPTIGVTEFAPEYKPNEVQGGESIKYETCVSLKFAQIEQDDEDEVILPKMQSSIL